jgi:hypothetical protein
MPTLLCPFRLLNSHGYNELGFRARQENRLAQACRIEGTTCLGLKFDRFAVTPMPDGRYTLK